MSSSHRKEAPTSELLPCPQCGKTQMVCVVETVRLENGVTVEKLRHYKCGACGSRFYDDQAIHRIQAARKSRSTSATTPLTGP